MSADVISMALAKRLWSVHCEIEAAQRRLLNDNFSYEIGVAGGPRLFRVNPAFARSVIEAHIADKHKELAEACEEARCELAGEAP